MLFRTMAFQGTLLKKNEQEYVQKIDNFKNTEGSHSGHAQCY